MYKNSYGFLYAKVGKIQKQYEFIDPPTLDYIHIHVKFDRTCQ